MHKKFFPLSCVFFRENGCFLSCFFRQTYWDQKIGLFPSIKEYLCQLLAKILVTPNTFKVHCSCRKWIQILQNSVLVYKTKLNICWNFENTNNTRGTPHYARRIRGTERINAQRRNVSSGTLAAYPGQGSELKYTASCCTPPHG